MRTDHVNLDIIWSIVCDHLPPLKAQVEGLLSGEEKGI